MLKIDMGGLSEKEPEDAVARQCSICGTVKYLRTHPASGTLAGPLPW